MELKEKYIRKYWYQMVEDQIADEYTEKGYTVVRNCEIANGKRADLLAHKGDEHIIIEIVERRKSNAAILQLYHYARETGYEVRLVVANYSHLETIIEFDEFYDSFVEFLNNDNPGEFGEFATHSRVDEIEECTFKSIKVNGASLLVEGNCIVSLETWMDNEGDTDFTYHVPIAFELSMLYEDADWVVDDCIRLDIDTSQLN